VGIPNRHDGILHAAEFRCRRIYRGIRYALIKPCYAGQQGKQTWDILRIIVFP
jgi:hypothetical protein